MFPDSNSRSFMRGLDFDERKRGREKSRLSLRKKNREEILRKRRQCLVVDETDTKESQPGQPSFDLNVEVRRTFFCVACVRCRLTNQTNNDKHTRASTQLARVHEYTAGLQSHDPSVRFNSIRKLREIVAIADNPPIHHLSGETLLKCAVSLLLNKDHPRIQLEAAWFLTNIASGAASYTRLVVSAGAIEAFKTVIDDQSHDRELMRQCLWGIANICGESDEFRQRLLKPELLTLIYKLTQPEKKRGGKMMMSESDLNCVRDAVWCLSNLCRWGKNGCYVIPKEFARVMTGTMVQVIRRYQFDREAVDHVLWSAAMLCDIPHDDDDDDEDDEEGCDNDDENVTYQVTLGDLFEYGYKEIFDFVVDCLQVGHEHLSASLRITGNFLAGSDDVTNAVCQMGIIPKIKRLLFASSKRILKETAWICHNLIVSPAHVYEIIDDDVVDKLIDMILNDPMEAVQKEACWCLGNLVFESNENNVLTLIEKGAFTCVIRMLNQYDNKKMLRLGMQVMTRVLEVGLFLQKKMGANDNPLIKVVEEHGGVDALEKIQASDFVDEEMYDLAVKTMEKFWDVEREDESDMSMWNSVLKPATTSDGHQFAFSCQDAGQAKFSF